MRALVWSRMATLADGARGPELADHLPDWMGWQQVDGTPHDLPIDGLTAVWVWIDKRSGVKYAASLEKKINDTSVASIVRKTDGTLWIELSEEEEYKPQGLVKNIWFYLAGK